MTVMFVVEVVAATTARASAHALVTAAARRRRCGSSSVATLWLWSTVALRQLRRGASRGRRRRTASLRLRKAAQSRRRSTGTAPTAADEGRARSRQPAQGDVVLIEAGDIVPVDGEVIDGVASVDESAITGESAPVIRESGGDFSAVTGGTRVLSDWIVVRVTNVPADLPRPHDRDGRGRQAPEDAQRIALTILLVALTIVFLGVTVATLLPFSAFGVQGPRAPAAGEPGDPRRAARVPDPDRSPGCSRRSASPAWPHDAGQRDRDLGRAVGGRRRRRRAAARQDRHDHARQPPGGGASFRPPGSSERLADAAQLASPADETPEGRSIVVLAQAQNGSSCASATSTPGATFVPSPRRPG